MNILDNFNSSDINNNIWTILQKNSSVSVVNNQLKITGLSAYYGGSIITKQSGDMKAPIVIEFDYQLQGTLHNSAASAYPYVALLPLSGYNRDTAYYNMVWGSNCFILELDTSIVRIGLRTANGPVNSAFGSCSVTTSNMNHYKLIINPLTKNIQLFLNNNATPSINVTPSNFTMPTTWNVEFQYGNYGSGPAVYDNISIIQNGTKFLLKQYNAYYSVKPEYYNADSKMYIPLTLAGGLTPNTSDIETFGFENISDMLNSITISDQTFKPIDKLYDKFEIKAYKHK